MNSNYLEEFIKGLAKNPELTQKFKEAADKGTNEAYKFALNHSKGNFTKEEFEEYMLKLTKECVELESKKLEDNSLENVAGGTDDYEKVSIKDVPENLHDYAKTWETKLKNDDDSAKDRINWIKGTGSITKLANTITNIGFSIYKVSKDKKNKYDDSEDIKIEELREKIAIKKLENQLKKLGIDDYESLLG